MPVEARQHPGRQTQADGTYTNGIPRKNKQRWSKGEVFCLLYSIDKVAVIDSLDDGGADADDGPVKKVQQEVVSKDSKFFDDDDEIFDSPMEMPVDDDDGADAGTN